MDSHFLGAKGHCVSVPVFETSSDDGIFISASFPPVDSMIIAAACAKGGTKLFDIRQNSFRYWFYLNTFEVMSLY